MNRRIQKKCAVESLEPRILLSSTQLIRNGGFEGAVSSNDWVRNGAFQADSRFGSPRTGTGYAYLSNTDGSAGNNLSGFIYQSISIPAAMTSGVVQFYTKITTQETTAKNDFFAAQILASDGSTTLQTLVGLSNLNASSSYVVQSFALSPSLAGKTVEIDFSASTNLTLPTVFRVDDVSLMVTTPAPTALTSSATNVTNNSAQLNGAVNPNGTNSSAYFEYGPTTSYGGTTNPVSVGSGTTSIPVFSSIFPLNQDTSFHYRVVAVNASADVTYGPDVAFYTPLPAPTLSMPSDGQTGTPTVAVQFGWSQVLGNQGYRMILDTNASNLPTDPNSSVDSTAVINATRPLNVDSGTSSVVLLPATTYYWTVHATGFAGGGLWSSPRSFSTVAPLTHLMINPNFAQIDTVDPVNAALIESTVDQAIRIYERYVMDPITVNITFDEDPTISLGESTTLGVVVNYADYRNALLSHATTVNDGSAIASLPNTSNNPITNNTQVTLKPPLARALGLGGNFASDGTISLNTQICNLSRDSSNPAKYDLMAVAMHEMDEILAFGSALDGAQNGSVPSTTIKADDLFRYDQNGARIYNTGSSTQAFFSVDGGKTLLARFNQSGGEDFGDWFSPGNPPRVQDAASTPGAAPNLGVELTRLDVLGFAVAAENPPNTPTNVTPVDGAAAPSLTPTLSASDFSDPDSPDTHGASEWIIRRVSDGSIIADTATDTVNLTNFTPPSLAYGTTYTWQVRYQDNRGEWSSFSSATTFVTPRAPVVVVMVGANAVSNGQTNAINFGDATEGGTGPTRSFTVKNTGGAALILSTVSVPAGYTVTTDITSSLTAGAQEIFTVLLNTDVFGVASGIISFTTNDPSNPTFSFPVTGAVDILALNGQNIDFRGYGDNAHIIVQLPSGFNVYPLGQIAGIEVTGTASNDTLTIDYSDGSPLPLSGLVFSGGLGTNTLTIIGSSSQNQADFVGTNNGGTVTVNGATITFTNVSSFDFAGNGDDALSISGPIPLVFNTGDGNESITIASQASATVNLGASNADLTIVNNGNLLLNAGTGNPSVQFAAALPVGGGAKPPAPSGVISGRAFNDLNANGFRNVADKGLAGRTVYIDSNRNGRLDPGEPRTATAADGAYHFSNLSAGHYLIRTLLPAGWRSSGNNSYDLALAAGQNRGDKDFAETQLGLISGLVFRDRNGDGKQDAGEAAMAGVLVYLDGKLDNGEASFTTATDGKFAFNVKAGKYALRVATKKGFTHTSPAGGYLITVGAGQTVSGKNFGER